MGMVIGILENWRVKHTERTWSIYSDSRPGYRRYMFLRLADNANPPIKVSLEIDNPDSWYPEIASAIARTPNV